MNLFREGADIHIDPLLTKEQLLHVMPECDVDTWQPLLTSSMGQWGIVAKHHIAAFLAQIAHESNQLRQLEEAMWYSPRRLMAVWPSRFKSHDEALPFAFNPEKLANHVYANRMGNGPPESGDGWRFRGGGPIMLTGRANYRRAQNATGYLLTAMPETLREPSEEAADVAAWWWMDRDLNDYADELPIDLPAKLADAPFARLTQRINGGTTGIEDRREYWEKAREALA